MTDYAPASYTGNGSTTDFVFTFPYLDAAHVKVSLNGVATSAFTLISAGTVRMNSAPANGVEVKVYRQTPGDPITTWSDGTIILGRNLNAASAQARYISEEARNAVEVNAEDAITAAEAQATAAAASAAAAATSATAANTAKTAAQTAKSGADTAKADAETAKTAAQSAKSGAETAQAAAETAKTAAQTAKAGAETAQAAAETAKAGAETAKAGADTAKAGAETARDAAASSATAASGSASTATTKASDAAASATAAAGSATAAAASATSAAATETLIEAIYDAFDDRYLGMKSSDPATDNDGDPLEIGALYFNTTTNELRIYTSGGWVAAYIPSGSSVASFNGRTGSVSPAAGDYAIADITGLVAALAAKIAIADIVDTLASTAADKPLSAKQGKALKDTADALATTVAGKAAASHTHAQSDITNLVSDLAAKIATSSIVNNLTSGGTAVPLSAEQGKTLKTLVDGKAAASHTHPQSDVTNLVSDLAGKAAASHGHAQSDITNLVSDLAGKAPASHDHDSRYYTESEVDAMMGMRLLASGTVSNAAQLDISAASYSGYRGFKIVLSEFIPATDDTLLHMRTSTDGGANFDAGASDYRYALTGYFTSNTTQNLFSGGAAQIVIFGVGGASARIGNGAAEGADVEITTLNCANNAQKTRYWWQGSYYAALDGAVAGTGVGHRNAAQDTDAWRFFFSTGNIASGKWALIGIK
jgi:hypothetical protein